MTGRSAVAGCWGALAVALAAVSCAAPAAGIDPARARAHIDMLAGTIGSRPIGSAADARAREYVVGQLRRQGFDVRVQDADAVDRQDGITSHVANVIAVRPGQADAAIALVSHYDSVPDGPGAADDALGVAICLESSRLLAAQPLRHALVVLVTDGEEVGLMGARAAVADPEIGRRVRAFLNFDGTGTGGMPVLFEAGPGWGAPLDAWTRAPAPFGGSLGLEIYQRLPNDTDFTILKSLGASGLNFAPVGDSYAYHTDRDVAGRVDDRTIRLEIANTVAIVRALDATDFASRSATPTFFDLLARHGVVYGPAATVALAATAILLGVAAWVLATLRIGRAQGWWELVRVAGWSALGTAAAVGAMIGGVWIVRAVRRQITPWYAAPIWSFLLLLVAAALAWWIVRWLASIAPPALRPRPAPLATWWATLPVWIAGATVLTRAAPAASYLVTLPLTAASCLLLVSRGHVMARVASLVALGVAAVLWLSNVILLLTFLVPLVGWLPIVTPIWLYPAVMTVAGLFLVPPALALAAGASARVRRPARVVMVLGALLVACAGIAALVPAYDAAHPARRAVRYVRDDIVQGAWWEVAGPEPSLGIDERGVPGANWQPVVDPIPTAVRIGSLGPPFAFRTPATSATDLPATVRSSWLRAGDRGVLEIAMVPTRLLAARVVLPGGVVPIDADVAGAVGAGGRWTAAVVPVPETGWRVRLTLRADARGALDRTAVVLVAAGLPGGSGPHALPGWLPVARDTWQARSIFVVSARPAPAPSAPGGVAAPSVR